MSSDEGTSLTSLSVQLQVESSIWRRKEGSLQKTELSSWPSSGIILIATSESSFNEVHRDCLKLVAQHMDSGLQEKESNGQQELFPKSG
jgi:hypothetical protein